MKQQILIVFILFFSNPAISQEFAPIGAKWHYTEKYVGPGDWENEYSLKIIAVKDTIIEGQSCIELRCDYLCWHPYDVQYVYSSNDSVYFYDQLLDTFKLIYIFNASAGEEWGIPIYGGGPDERIDFRLIIDSVDTRLVNSEELSVQYVTYFCYIFNKEETAIDSFWYNSEIIEYIGDISYLFNIPELLLTWCDHNYSNGLRCYEDSFFGLYETGIAPFCDYEYVDVEEPILDSISFYPNPTQDKIYFTTEISNLKQIDIYNVLGQRIESYNPEEIIDFSHLKDGVYFLATIAKSNVVTVHKLIKQSS